MTPVKWYRRKAVRVLGAALLGALIGASCGFLPVEYHKACHLAAKLLSLVLGGH